MALRRQLEAMLAGGVFAITAPELPCRCPSGPHDRTCQIASYFKAAKRRSKVLVQDANAEVTSQAALFKKVWATNYHGLVEYRLQRRATSVDGKTRSVRFEVQEDVRANVLNVLLPMRAGSIAVRAGLANSNARWCQVNFLDFEPTAARMSKCSATRSRSRQPCRTAHTWPTALRRWPQSRSWPNSAAGISTRRRC